MIILLIAERDIAEAVNWYENQREGYGERFQESLERVFDQIERAPEMHPLIQLRVRRALTPRFPFAVYYRIENDEAIVFAVLHSRRDPRLWKSRV